MRHTPGMNTGGAHYSGGLRSAADRTVQAADSVSAGIAAMSVCCVRGHVYVNAAGEWKELGSREFYLETMF